MLKIYQTSYESPKTVLLLTYQTYTIMFILTKYIPYEYIGCLCVSVRIIFDLSSHSNVWSRAGLGAAESPQGLQRCTGLRQGLSELHLRVHL